LAKGFLQVDLRKFAEVLLVMGDDQEALLTYVWLLASAPEGTLVGKERVLAARAHLRGPLELRVVLNRLATMRWRNQVLISLDNGPKGVAIIRIKELSGIVIRRGSGSKNEVVLPDFPGEESSEPENEGASPESEPGETEATAEPGYEAWHESTGSSGSQTDDRILAARANLSAHSPRAVELMVTWLSTLAFSEPDNCLPARTEFALWNVANEIVAGFDASSSGGPTGEQTLINALLVAQATPDLTTKSAGKFLLACARRSAQGDDARTAHHRAGARVEAKRAESGAPNAPSEDGLRVHSNPSSSDF